MLLGINSFLHLFYLYIFLFSISAKDVVVNRPRGVSLSNKILFDSSKDFTCFDGSKTIPFSSVNDDYCDCSDGSDEPGTPACPNGLYHCTNAGYRPKNIPSSRVNDGICDCCDGSDEWKNESLCPNTCVDLWRIAREELEKQLAEANEGYVTRQEYSKTGKAKKEERQTALAEYEAKLLQLAEEEKILSQVKEEIEAKESVAREERRKIMQEELDRKAEEENLARGAKSFAEMDIDKDASLTLSEFVVHTELDPDATDGEFTEDEAMKILLQAAVDLDQFMETVWPHINTTFQTSLLPPKEEQETPPETEENLAAKEEEAFREEEVEKQAEVEDQEEDEEDEYFDNEEDEDYDEEDSEPPPPPSGEELYYDDATRAVIEQANEARSKYDANQEEKKKVESEISTLKKALEIDFGSDEAFQALQFQCYELTTLEYVYKLCPFDKTSQKPKSGGAETSLGRWGHWSGPPNFKHSAMKYQNGQGCWNGPSRSTEVKIRCGVENKLLSVDEPSRCTYVMEFATPCACAAPQDPDAEESSHDEL